MRAYFVSSKYGCKLCGRPLQQQPGKPAVYLCGPCEFNLGDHVYLVGVKEASLPTTNYETTGEVWELSNTEAATVLPASVKTEDNRLIYVSAAIARRLNLPQVVMPSAGKKT